MLWNKLKTKKKEDTEVDHCLCHWHGPSKIFLTFLKKNWVSMSWNSLWISVDSICFASYCFSYISSTKLNN